MSNEINRMLLYLFISTVPAKTPRGIATFLYTPRDSKGKKEKHLQEHQSSLTEEFPD